ncbi:hypothetical protein GBA52_005516 [Prunus armeniaca]|nr:hypothetical protein GBA52_005516 [Prunus armeniaca]
MSNIPQKLIFDILSRLEPKDLIRYTCVSKAWYALIHNQDFIKAHHERSIKQLYAPSKLEALRRGKFQALVVEAKNKKRLSEYLLMIYVIFVQKLSLAFPPSKQSPTRMAAISLRKGNTRLPPEVNRVLYVRNLPFNISSEEMYDIFGKYGAIRQIRIGTNKDTRGTAFVVYEDIYDAKTAVDHLSGFNVANRYLIVLYYQQAKMGKKLDQRKKEEEIAKMQEKYGVSTKDK